MRDYNHLEYTYVFEIAPGQIGKRLFVKSTIITDFFANNYEVPAGHFIESNLQGTQEDIFPRALAGIEDGSIIVESLADAPTGIETIKNLDSSDYPELQSESIFRGPSGPRYGKPSIFWIDIDQEVGEPYVPEIYIQKALSGRLISMAELLAGEIGPT